LATQVNNASMRRWRRCDATSYCRCIQARGDTPSLAQIPEALDAVRAGSIDGTVSQYPYVMGQMAVEACAAAAAGARLPARVDAPIALLTKDNVGPAIAAFPRPVQRYTDPFSRLIRRQG